MGLKGPKQTEQMKQSNPSKQPGKFRILRDSSNPQLNPFTKTLHANRHRHPENKLNASYTLSKIMVSTPNAKYASPYFSTDFHRETQAIPMKIQTKSSARLRTKTKAESNFWSNALGNSIPTNRL